MTAKKCTKKWDAGAKLLVFNVINLLLFLMFSLHLKLPNRSAFLSDGGGGGVALFNQFACPLSCFSLSTSLI